MKRSGLCYIALLLCLSLIGQAQETKPYRFGLKIGPNINWLKPDAEGYTTDGTEVGFSWGFIGDFTMADNYFLSTGFNLQYNNGRLIFPYKEEGIDTTGQLHRKYVIKYFQIPIMIKMRTERFSNFEIFGQIGLTGDIRISAKGKDVFEYPDKSGTVITTSERETSITDNINLFKGAFVVGGGAEYFIDKSTSIMISINYNNGLTNVLSGSNTVDPAIKERAQLHYIEFNVGVIF
jgi:opacity protein-like surface antigen